MITKRSQQKELIDLGPNYYSHQEYKDCLKKLFHINKFFGFFHDTKKLLAHFSKESTLLDFGCGGGLFLLHLSKHFPKMSMLGLDINSEAIDEAQQELEIWQKKRFATHVTFQFHQQTDAILMKNQFDIVLATLVCHHLSDNELIDFLRLAYKNARQAVIINDIHRHILAHWLYALLSPILFRNRLITHDGLISIQRGFTRSEWKLLLKKADISNYQIKWCFPFRWRLILWK